MSIWCSWQTIGWDDEGANFGARILEGGSEREPRPHWNGGEVRSYAEGFSNHYPDGTHEPCAAIGLASIAPWCVPGHLEDAGALEQRPVHGPWLRMEVDGPYAVSFWGEEPTVKPQSATVVMDEAAVQALRDQLTEWLDAEKVHPKPRIEGRR